MTGFESWASGVGSDLSANKAQRMPEQNVWLFFIIWKESQFVDS